MHNCGSLILCIFTLSRFHVSRAKANLAGGLVGAKLGLVSGLAGAKLGLVSGIAGAKLGLARYINVIDSLRKQESNA